MQHTVIFVWVHLTGTFDCVPCMHEFMTPDSRVGQALGHAILELPLQAPVDSDPVWKTPTRAASQPRAVTHCWAMAKLPPAEQWCVCGVGQPHRRCQDRETLQPTQYTRQYGAMCRLGFLDKRRAKYVKKKDEEERRAAAPLTRAQFTAISGIFGAHWSPSHPHIDPRLRPTS